MTEPAEPVTLLHAIKQQQNRSWPELAKLAVKAFEKNEPDAPRLSISDRNLRRIALRERGEDSTPSDVTTRALQYAFGYPIEQLLGPAEPGLLPTSRTGTFPAKAEEFVLMAAHRVRRFSALQTTSAEAVDSLRESVSDLTLAYPARPLTEILGHLVEHQDAVFTLLERPQRPAQSRDLYFLGGVLGGMLTKASHDLGDPTAALVQSQSALMCADLANSDGLRAWIRGLQSLVSYWANRPHKSVQYAQLGMVSAERAGNSSTAWLPASEARAWARLGNAEKAQQAIAKADAAWATVQPDELDELGGIAQFSEMRQVYFAADALAWLPDQAEATVRYAEQAVERYSDSDHPDWAFGDAAGSRADLAIARIGAGDHEGAADALAPVLDLPPEQRINGIIHSANRVHRALTRVGHGAAGDEIQKQIETYTRTPMRALPR